MTEAQKKILGRCDGLQDGSWRGLTDSDFTELEKSLSAEIEKRDALLRRVSAHLAGVCDEDIEIQDAIRALLKEGE